MSEPEPTGLPPVSSQRGTQPMALPPLSLPPSKIDPLSSLSTHHSYSSPMISSQMMASPLMSMSPSPSSQVHSPLNQHILSPQSKSSFGQNAACSTSIQNQQQPQLQDFRRQNLMPNQSQDNYRAQFSHTVTTLPSNKRNVAGVHDIIGRQIQSVPSSPTMSSNSTPPQSVQMVRHGSLDALPSPGSSSSMGNPSPSSYSNHSSPMMTGQAQNMPNGHGSHSSFPTQQASIASQSHVVQRVAYSNQEHSGGGAIQIPQKQIVQQDSTQGRIPGQAGIPHMSVSMHQPARNHQQVLTTGSSYGVQPHQNLIGTNPSPLQQQLSSRPSQTESSSQANVLIQHQPLPPQNGTGQGQGPSLQPNQQQTISARQLLHQQEMSGGPTRSIPSREVMASPQIVTSQQQTVLGLLQGAAQQQVQAVLAAATSSTQSPSLSHQQVRQMLSQRTQNTISVPNTPSTTSSLQQVLSTRPPPLPVATQRSAQQPGQIMVQHPIHPSQANLPVRSVLAAQQQVLLQQQSRLPLQNLPGPSSASTSSSAARVSSASSAPVLAAVYDLDKPGIKSNKQQYRTFKKKFKYLVFENECYQEELRNLQRKLLKLSRDKNFLLDRLMQFEKLSDSSDDDSDSSQKTADERPKTKKRIRPSQRKRTADEPLSDSGSKRFMDGSMGSTPSPSPSPAPSVATVLAPSTSSHYAMSPVGSTPDASPVKTASVHHCPPGPSTVSAVVRPILANRSSLSSKDGVDPSIQRQSSQRLESHLSPAIVDTRPSPLKVKVESLPLPPAKKNFAVMNPTTSSSRTFINQPIQSSSNTPGLSGSVSLRNSMQNGSAVQGPVTSSLPTPLIPIPSGSSFSVAASSTAPSPSDAVQHFVSMVPPQLGIRTISTLNSAPSLPPSVSHLNGQMPVNLKKEGGEDRSFVSLSQPR